MEMEIEMTVFAVMSTRSNNAKSLKVVKFPKVVKIPKVAKSLKKLKDVNLNFQASVATFEQKLNNVAISDANLIISCDGLRMPNNAAAILRSLNGYTCMTTKGTTSAASKTNEVKSVASVDVNTSVSARGSTRAAIVSYIVCEENTNRRFNNDAINRDRLWPLEEWSSRFEYHCADHSSKRPCRNLQPNNMACLCCTLMSSHAFLKKTITLSMTRDCKISTGSAATIIAPSATVTATAQLAKPAKTLAPLSASTMTDVKLGSNSSQVPISQLNSSASSIFGQSQGQNSDAKGNAKSVTSDNLPNLVLTPHKQMYDNWLTRNWKNRGDRVIVVFETAFPKEIQVLDSRLLHQELVKFACVKKLHSIDSSTIGPFQWMSNLETLQAKLKAKGQTTPMNFTDAYFPKVLLLFGNENSGISPSFMQELTTQCTNVLCVSIVTPHIRAKPSETVVNGYNASILKNYGNNMLSFNVASTAQHALAMLYAANLFNPVLL